MDDLDKVLAWRPPCKAISGSGYHMVATTIVDILIQVHLQKREGWGVGRRMLWWRKVCR